MTLKNNFYLSLIRLVIFIIYIQLPKNKFIKNFFNKNIIKLVVKPQNLIIINKNILQTTKKGFIVLSNHLSYIDSFVIKSIITDTKFIGRKEIHNNFFVRNQLDTILYDKYDPNSGENVKKEILKLVKKNNEIITVFPEGIMNNNMTNDLAMFKKGLFYLAYENNIPILMSIIYCNNKNYAIGNPINSLKTQLNLIRELFFFNNNNIIIYELINFVYPKDFSCFEEYYNFIYSTMNINIKKYSK